MSRKLCDECQYPISACVCSAISPVTSNTQVIVLQHPSEVGHAKNSVRLMQLVLPDMQVVVGEKAEDFTALKQQLEQSNNSVYLVYPSEKSQSVTQVSPAKDSTIVLIDGTWKKAYKMLQLNPWLLDYPAIHLDMNHQSNYIIRKAKRADSLSTLEATAHVLGGIDASLDTTPLFAALDAMVQHRLQAMPEQVRQRYQLSTKDDS